MVVLGWGAVSYERGIPVINRQTRPRRTIRRVEMRRGGLNSPRHVRGAPMVNVLNAKPRSEILNCGLFFRGTSLIRNTPRPGPYSRTMPRDLWGSKEGGCFFWARYPCSCLRHRWGVPMTQSSPLPIGLFNWCPVQGYLTCKKKKRTLQ